MEITALSSNKSGRNWPYILSPVMKSWCTLCICSCNCFIMHCVAYDLLGCHHCCTYSITCPSFLQFDANRKSYSNLIAVCWKTPVHHLCCKVDNHTSWKNHELGLLWIPLHPSLSLLFVISITSHHICMEGKHVTCICNPKS